MGDELRSMLDEDSSALVQITIMQLPFDKIEAQVRITGIPDLAMGDRAFNRELSNSMPVVVDFILDTWVGILQRQKKAGREEESVGCEIWSAIIDGPDAPAREQSADFIFGVMDEIKTRLTDEPSVRAKELPKPKHLQ